MMLRRCDGCSRVLTTHSTGLCERCAKMRKRPPKPMNRKFDTLMADTLDAYRKLIQASPGFAQFTYDYTWFFELMQDAATPKWRQEMEIDWSLPKNKTAPGIRSWSMSIEKWRKKFPTVTMRPMYESVPYGLYDALPKDVPWKHGEFPWVSAYISCPVQKLAAAHRLTILVERTYEICTCDLEGGMQIDAHIIAAVRKGFERRAWYEVMRCELMEELVPLMFKTWHRHVRGEDGMGHGQPKWT